MFAYNNLKYIIILIFNLLDGKMKNLWFMWMDNSSLLKPIIIMILQVDILGTENVIQEMRKMIYMIIKIRLVLKLTI